MTEKNDKFKPEKTGKERELPRVPPLSRWDTAMDEVIEEAMRNGDFDNLQGKGKPLNLSKNPYGAEYELAYGLLKNNDYTLPWIAQRSEIFEEIALFREKFQETWALYSAEFQMSQDQMTRQALAAGWRHYLNNEAQNEIIKINKQIADINLKQPREVVEILKLVLRDELIRAKAAEALG